jgi:hypothetical protein
MPKALLRSAIALRKCGSACSQSAGSSQSSFGGLDGDTEPRRRLAHSIIETQQSKANDGGTPNEQRRKVDRIEGPDRITGKRLTRAINDLPRDSQHMPMSSSLDEVRLKVGRFSLRQFLERHCPQ